jgi:hypothetical protein
VLLLRTLPVMVESILVLQSAARQQQQQEQGLCMQCFSHKELQESHSVCVQHLALHAAQSMQQPSQGFPVVPWLPLLHLTSRSHIALVRQVLAQPLQQRLVAAVPESARLLL